MTLERPMFPPRREVETIEPISLQDAFCTALARVERVGPCRRLIFTVPDDSAPESPLRVVVAKLMLPADMLAEIAAQLLDVPVDVAGAAMRHGAAVN